MAAPEDNKDVPNLEAFLNTKDADHINSIVVHNADHHQQQPPYLLDAATINNSSSNNDDASSYFNDQVQVQVIVEGDDHNGVVGHFVHQGHGHVENFDDHNGSVVCHFAQNNHHRVQHAENLGNVQMENQQNVFLPQPVDLREVSWQVISRDEEDYFASLPPGYRFCPSDTELVIHYLDRKVQNLPLPRNQIREVNLYQESPELISAQHPSIGKHQWYFFTPREKKYLNGSRPNRAAGNGFWKATGADKAIFENDAAKAQYEATKTGPGPIGYRKALVYYEGKPPKGTKTNWIMHEFKLLSTDEESKNKKRSSNGMRLDDVVLCKIHKKVGKSLKGRETSEAAGSSEGASSSVVANQENENHSPNLAPNHSMVESINPQSYPTLSPSSHLGNDQSKSVYSINPQPYTLSPSSHTQTGNIESQPAAYPNPQHYPDHHNAQSHYSGNESQPAYPRPQFYPHHAPSLPGNSASQPAYPHSNPYMYQNSYCSRMRYPYQVSTNNHPGEHHLSPLPSFESQQSSQYLHCQQFTDASLYMNMQEGTTSPAEQAVDIRGGVKQEENLSSQVNFNGNLGNSSSYIFVDYKKINSYKPSGGP